MRDIRNDLQERAQVIDEQIRAAYDWFEQTAQQLQRQRDERVSELQDTLVTLNKLIRFENSAATNVVALDEHPSLRPLPIDGMRATGT